MAASGVSSDMPAPPCTWMARSMTFVAARGRRSWPSRPGAGRPCCPRRRSPRRPSWHSSRACSISSRDSATCCCSMPWSASGPPNATRVLARSHHHRQRPLRRAQRPHAVVDPAGAEPGLGRGEPAALLAEHVGHRHPDAVEAHLRVPVLVVPAQHRQVPHDRDPGGVERHQHHRLLPVRRGAAGRSCPSRSAAVQRGSSAPLVHHLRPVMTYSSPSRSIRVVMLVASEEATSGSVIANPERIVPASSGSSHSCCCAGVPIRCSSSMLPVSGAAQLIASGASSRLQPDSSAIGAYSSWVSPETSGRNRFHSPRRAPRP